MKLKGPGTLRVGRKILQFADDTRKWNPNSLRFLIGFMMNIRFEGDRLRADKYFSLSPSVYRHEKQALEKKKLNNKSIADILNDNTHIYYWQIECFADLFNIPSGVMLIVSRLMSQIRDGKTQSAAQEIRGIAEMASILQHILETEELDEADLEKIASCFPGDKNQGQMPLSASQSDDL